LERYTALVTAKTTFEQENGWFSCTSFLISTVLGTPGEGFHSSFFQVHLACFRTYPHLPPTISCLYLVLTLSGLAEEKCGKFFEKAGLKFFPLQAWPCTESLSL
jgi:hypothetical protein